MKDITDSSCLIERIEYDGGNVDDPEAAVLTPPISTSKEAFPPGTVLETFGTSAKEAEAAGLAYVTLSGNYSQDAQAVESLEMKLRSSAQRPVESSDAASCRSRTVTNNLSYTANGGTVYASVRYYQSTTCTWYLNYSSAYQYGVISTKHGWDRVLYNGGGQYSSWGQGCASLKPDGTFRSNSYSGWWINLGGFYTNKSTNTNLVVDYGCAGWATTYSGSVQLWG